MKCNPRYDSRRHSDTRRLSKAVSKAEGRDLENSTLFVVVLEKYDFLNCLISRMEIIILCFFLSFWARQPPVGQGLLIHEVARSHTTTRHTR
jgi:hypothetical protein